MKRRSTQRSTGANERKRAFFSQLMQVNDDAWKQRCAEKAERAAVQGRSDEAIDHARASKRWLDHSGLEHNVEVVKGRLKKPRP